MSTRWYPIYQKGNPQLRVFLPNFWMKLVNPAGPPDVPPNHVKFIVSNGMSRFDVQNYLEKIYNVPVVSVKTGIKQGKTREVRGKRYIVKDDDFKVAWVTLPKGTKFEFPDIFLAEKTKKDLEADEKNLDAIRAASEPFHQRRKLKPDLPGWFV